MPSLSLAAIIEATGAQAVCTGEVVVSAVSADSRQILPGCLFVALRGDSFDGHHFVSQALADGAAFAVVEAGTHVEAPPEKLLAVADTRQALLAIAGLHRQLFAVEMVAITGSVGKTTTKEMIACVCQSRFSTLKTEMNLNNEIGVSQMLFKLAPTHQVAVLEMGMDGPGQIAPISRAVAPDIAVVTNIGVSHLEAMGTMENTCREKLAIRAGMSDGGVLLLNGDDPMLKGLQDDRLTILLYGLNNPDFAIWGHDIEEHGNQSSFVITYEGQDYPAVVPAIGRHNIGNALAAFGVGVTLGLHPAEAAAALRHYAPAGMRQRVTTHKAFTIVEDCYNASPDSMKAALETLGHMPCRGRRIAVLADMLELGTVAEESHRAVGALAATCGVDMLFCTGPLAHLYQTGAIEAGMEPEQARYFGGKDGLLAGLKEAAKAGDVLWFKASRGMHLEDVLEKIHQEW